LTKTLALSAIVPVLALTACATAQMHTEPQLNEVAMSCGLDVGDVVQDADEKRLLFLFRVAPKPQQRHCIYQWARKNHLTLVVINAVNQPETPAPKS
jgi:hypothetical protein